MVLAVVSRWLPLSSIKKAIKIVHTTTNHVVAQPVNERVSHTCMYTITTTREIERKKERRMYGLTLLCWWGVVLYTLVSFWSRTCVD